MTSNRAIVFFDWEERALQTLIVLTCFFAILLFELKKVKKYDVFYRYRNSYIASFEGEIVLKIHEIFKFVHVFSI